MQQNRRTARGIEWTGLVGDAHANFQPAPEAFRSMGVEEGCRRLRMFIQDVLGSEMLGSPSFVVDFYQ